MKAELKCICNSIAIFEDESAVYVKERIEDWLDRHNKCLVLSIVKNGTLPVLDKEK